MRLPNVPFTDIGAAERKIADSYLKHVRKLIRKSVFAYLTRFAGFRILSDMDIGYARVSTGDQSLELQKEALEKAGVDPKYVYEDVTSGANFERPGLEAAMKQLREGDALVVWRLDRLGRSLKDLIETVNALAERGIGFKSLTESIDTTTSGGRLVFHIFGALAEFEREIIRERTMAGLNSARARGRYGGRPRAMDERKVRMARAMLSDQGNSVADVCEALGVSRSTLYKYVGPGGTGPARSNGPL